MRKKRLLLIFTFFYSIILADEVDETRDIRKYHQQLEERVFEVENKEEQDNKIKESFSHGKRRIENAIKNEEMKLEEEDKKTSEKLENLKIAEEK
uniref:hypothetical protein n=1 Tax=Fusobacterium sp. TaxID=68766 RepID=UPI0025BE98ED